MENTIKDQLLIDLLDFIEKLEDENDMLNCLLDIVEDDLAEKEAEELEDFTRNSEPSYSDALKVVAKAIGQDESLRESYRKKLVSVFYDDFAENTLIDEASLVDLKKIFDNSADRLLFDFVKDVNKEGVEASPEDVFLDDTAGIAINAYYNSTS